MDLSFWKVPSLAESFHGSLLRRPSPAELTQTAQSGALVAVGWVFVEIQMLRMVAKMVKER